MMKKQLQFFLGFLLLLSSVAVHAQSKTGVDYFDGKRGVLVKGLPQGDTKMLLVLEKRMAPLTGAVQDTTGKQVAKIDKVALNSTTATVYFTAQG